MKEKLRRFLYGRYGVDSLGWAIVIFSMILSFASSFIGLISDIAAYAVWVVSYILLGLEFYRMLSKNITARRKENARFLGIKSGIKKFFKLQINRIKDIRTHKYFACPKCKNNLRVPRGRGEITITCPVCKTRFDERT